VALLDDLLWPPTQVATFGSQATATWRPEELRWVRTPNNETTKLLIPSQQTARRNGRARRDFRVSGKHALSPHCQSRLQQQGVALRR